MINARMPLLCFALSIVVRLHANGYIDVDGIATRSSSRPGRRFSLKENAMHVEEIEFLNAKSQWRDVIC